MLVLPWSSTGRYIRHLEEEIRFLRAELRLKVLEESKQAPRAEPQGRSELAQKLKTHA